MTETLLLNWVYYHPVGHALEALKVGKGYADASPGLAVSVLLNAATPVELADACPWIERAYPIDTRDVQALGEAAPCLQAVPRDWHYVVTDERTVVSPFPFAADLRAFHDTAARYFRARRWRGLRFGGPAESAPPYRPNATIRLRLPEPAREFAAALKHDGPMIALLPAGSAEASLYPTRAWWTRLVRALGRSLPGARVYVTGVSESHARRTATSAFPGAALASLRRAGSVVDCYDIGLWNQAAVIERCDLLIAPHSGFAFLAPCVGTPWLAISGGRWIEYFFNDVPFSSVLPECPRYPCHSAMKPACVGRIERGRPVLCMDPRQLNPRIPEVIEAVRLLLDPGLTYDRSVALHRERMAAAGVTRHRLWSFDGAVPYDDDTAPAR